jgi:hypothetical protein
MFGIGTDDVAANDMLKKFVSGQVERGGFGIDGLPAVTASGH